MKSGSALKVELIKFAEGIGFVMCAKKNDDTKIFGLDTWKMKKIDSSKKQQQGEAWYEVVGVLARETK